MTTFAEIETRNTEALEARAGIENLDALQARRRKIAEKITALEAVHGPGGIWDERRRSLRGVIATEIREHLRDEGRKVTEAEIEDRSNADPRYIAFLDAGLDERIEYLTLKTQRDELTERIKNREFALLAYNAETRLQ
jgi:hypothetical protein